MTRPSQERQRELTREYLRTPKAMGVYCVRHMASGLSYVAATRDIRARCNRHRMELNTKADRFAPDLQAAWTRDGADAFEFVTLEELEPLDDPGYNPDEDLEVLLEMWLDKLQPFPPKGYNPPR